MFSSLFLSAQTDEQAQKITSSYDKGYLANLAAQSLEKSQAEKKAAISYAQARNIPITYTTKEGAFAELQRLLPDGTLLYYTTNNVDASKSTRANHLNTGGSTGYGLDGQNMIAYVWDAGHPRITHQEYDGPGGNNRVSIMDGATQLHYHAAHVAGTITASGVDPNAKGMAPNSKVRAYQWNNDLAEATTAASNGMLLSNHSYGYGAEGLSAYYFGGYIDESRNWDNLMFNAPYYLMVKAAGNDGERTHFNSEPLMSGYDMLSGATTSKNNLVVAAANDATVDNNGNLISVNIAGFSSPGPTDDLRIKPDITGNGVNVYSTYDGFNTAYNSISGTSMASPNVTGSLLLLQQHYNNINGNFMRAATLKGLALHTADDAGPIGPDVKYGWGLLNSLRAAETITQHGTESIIQEMVLNQGQTITLTIDSDGVNDLLASISWTDRPGNVSSGTNSPTAALVNDLDIRVIKNSATYHPWSLTSVTTNSKNGDNNKDPYERVDVANASGTYTLTITHKGSLVGGSQAFSLIITGLQVECSTVSVPQNILVNDITGSTAKITWDPIPGALYDLRYREAGAATWTEISDILTNNKEITGLDIYTEYEAEVRSKCPEGESSPYSSAFNFTTTGIVYCDSFPTSPLDYFYISNLELNTINNTSTHSAYSDFTDISTELVAGHTYEISITTTADQDYRTYYAVWIDYNRNGVFEPDERIFTAETNAGMVASGSFTVPSDVDPLSTTMRVSMSNNETIQGPCDEFDFGEVEDYTIHLIKLNSEGFIYEDGSWTPADPAGLSTSQDNILVVNGSTSFTTNIMAKNLTINPGASLAVEEILNIAGNLIINGELIFVSSATGNGELGPISESSTISGNATVQRYMSSNHAYRMVSSAVTTTTSIHDNWQEEATSNIHNPAIGFGTHITGSTIDQQNGFDGTSTGDPSMFTADAGTQELQAVSNTNVNTLSIGNPYFLFVRGDRSMALNNNESASETILRATGTLYSREFSQNYPTGNIGDFAMLGNPYQSTVDINSVFTNSTNVNPNQYYVYDPTLAAIGAYVTVDLNSGTNTFNSSANQYLQPGQGAQFTALTSGTSSVLFKESDKAPGNFTSTNAMGNNLTADNMLTIQLYTTENYNTDGPLHDSLGIIFADGNDNGLTPTDAVKPMNFEENLGINHSGTYLSIERRSMPQPEEIYTLYSSGYRHLDYIMKLTVDGLENSLFFLHDDFTEQITLLEATETIHHFEIDAENPLSIASDRFSIRNEDFLGVENNNLLSDIRLFPNPIEGNSFYIHAPKLNGETVSISLSDMLGRKIYISKKIFTGNTTHIDLAQDLNSAVYTVTIISNGETQNFKIIKP